jgi:hypothetical protein
MADAMPSQDRLSIQKSTLNPISCDCRSDFSVVLLLSDPLATEGGRGGHRHVSRPCLSECFSDIARTAPGHINHSNKSQARDKDKTVRGAARRILLESGPAVAARAMAAAASPAERVALLQVYPGLGLAMTPFVFERGCDEAVRRAKKVPFIVPNWDNYGQSLPSTITSTVLRLPCCSGGSAQRAMPAHQRCTPWCGCWLAPLPAMHQTGRAQAILPR